MEYRSDPLWHRIQAYSPDVLFALHPFSKKLAEEQGWSAEFTARAIEEYKKFIYLCCISPHGASPPNIVDDVWHLHLTYTVEYWQKFCRDVLFREIHHHPSSGNEDENDKYQALYSDTLALYKTTFLQEPPSDIWPHRSAPQAEVPPIEISSNTFFELGPRWRYLLLAIPFALTLVNEGEINPYALNGPEFLFFYVVLLGCTAAALYFSARARNDALATILITDVTDKYEAAWLAGQDERFSLLVNSALTRSGAIYGVQHETYGINYEHVSTSATPATEALLNYGLDTISYHGLNELSLQQSYKARDRFTQVKQAFNNIGNSIIIPLTVIMAGIIRIIQGTNNDKPVGYLVFLVIASVIALVAVQYYSDFHRTCEKIMREQHQFTDYMGDDFSRTIIFYGLAALTGQAAYGQLYTNYYNNLHNRRGNGDGGGGCSSGGGDGGGGGSCGGGGCGGCGGD
ncbi:MAG: hypothetical protein V4649_11485 [Bacteroidota bacterium]